MPQPSAVGIHSIWMPLGFSPGVRAMIARAWDGTPVTAEWVADSLDRYSKIKPGGGRDIWAMQEGAKVIREQAAKIARLEKIGSSQ